MHLEDFNYLHLVTNLGLALVLGTLVASRPWRRLMGMSLMPREMLHAQILIAVAGAIAVSVIGDSLARAFGLVGLGGFIRFRTGIRDPRDAAVFFLLIGLGMACGLGSVQGALVCAGFVVFVLVLLDLHSRKRPTGFVRLTVRSQDPRGVADLAQAAIEALPVIVRSSTMRIEAEELRFDVENIGDLRPQVIVDAVLSAAGDKVSAVHCEALDTLKGSVKL